MERIFTNDPWTKNQQTPPPLRKNQPKQITRTKNPKTWKEFLQMNGSYQLVEVEDFGLRTTSRKNKKKKNTQPLPELQTAPPLPTQIPKQALPTQEKLTTLNQKSEHIKMKLNHLTNCPPLQTNNQDLPTTTPMPTPEFLPTQTPIINTPRRKFLAARKIFEVKEMNSKEKPVSFTSKKCLSEYESKQEQEQQKHLNNRTVKCNQSPTHETTPSKKRKLEGGTEWREEGEGGISTLIKKWVGGERTKLSDEEKRKFK